MAAEVDHQEQRAVDGVALEDEAQGGADRDQRDDDEDDQRHQTVRSAGMGTGEVGRPSAPTGSSDSSISFV